jgi:hypothetical protein
MVQAIDRWDVIHTGDNRGSSSISSSSRDSIESDLLRMNALSLEWTRDTFDR